MTDSTLGAIERLLVALLVGFLIGLDRERQVLVDADVGPPDPARVAIG